MFTAGQTPQPGLVQQVPHDTNFGITPHFHHSLFHDPVLISISFFTGSQIQLLFSSTDGGVRNGDTVWNNPFSVPVGNVSCDRIVVPSVSVVRNAITNVNKFAHSETVHFVVKAFVGHEWLDRVVRLDR